VNCNTRWSNDGKNLGQQPFRNIRNNDADGEYQRLCIMMIIDYDWKDGGGDQLISPPELGIPQQRQQL
jgi:hypothetical protein